MYYTVYEPDGTPFVDVNDAREAEYYAEICDGYFEIFTENICMPDVNGEEQEKK